MTREYYPGNNEQNIRKALSSEWQMRNKNRVTKSKNKTARSKLLRVAKH